MAKCPFPVQPIMVGEQAAAVRQALEISYPLENGIIRSWEDMEHVWRYLFDDKMQINPKEKKVTTKTTMMACSMKGRGFMAAAMTYVQVDNSLAPTRDMLCRSS